MLLGRALLAPHMKTKHADEDATEAALRRIQQDDQFFCDTMETIPPQYYFPTDEEENWLKSAPKAAKKYHKNVQAQIFQESSKKSIKRAKFTPSEQKTNTERQIEAADEEKRQKQHNTPEQVTIKPNKIPSNVDLDGLKERLAIKIQAMREQRKADEKTGKRRNNTAKIEPPSKKRKTAAFNNTKSGKKDGEMNDVAVDNKQENGTKVHEDNSNEVSGVSISYGSLLLADDNGKNDKKKKTRNGQGVRGIKNLLKKAERNQQRMEELKKTEEGKALVQAKGWSKAIKQAAGEVVLDDPKLLRNKLKKKEKQKAKSAKEWKKRVVQQEIQKKEKQKKKLANMRGERSAAGAKDKKEKKAGKGPRAGFEGKKGEGFLNAEKK